MIAASLGKVPTRRGDSPCASWQMEDQVLMLRVVQAF